MPNAAGMPTVAEALSKVQAIAPADLTPALLADMGAVLGEVIARIQSPATYNDTGGTGRQFIPTTETRYFDGTGYAELIVDDIVPGTPVALSVYGSALPTPVLKEPIRGRGHNILAYQFAGGYYSDYYANGRGGFLRGNQNVSVTATWGFSATVPPDVAEAIRCEAAYRALIAGYVPLSGVGETVTIDGFSINTSAGISVWRESSPITLLHNTFLECVKRYEIPTARYLRKYAQSQRMS